jgi:hypothetical protein
MGVGDPVLLFDFEMGGARDPLTYARLNGTWGFLSGLIRMAPARRRSSLCFEVRCGLRGLGQSRERIRRRGRFAAAGLDVVDGDHPHCGKGLDEADVGIRLYSARVDTPGENGSRLLTGRP